MSVARFLQAADNRAPTIQARSSLSNAGTKHLILHVPKVETRYGISPHNFTGCPFGPSEPMAWPFHSERDGETVCVDMLAALRVLEKLSGEKLVHIGNRTPN